MTSASANLSSDHVGVALVGGGLIAYLHALGARAAPRAKLVTVSSRGRRRARHMGLMLGIDDYTFDEHQPMFERSDVGLVVVGSPNGLHTKHALEAAALGKAVLVEKPLTLTLADAKLLCDAQRAGAMVGYAENHVFAPLMQTFAEQLRDGAVGRVRRIIAHFANPALPAESWHHSRDVSGGGALVDLGSHLIATCEWLLHGQHFTEVSSATITLDEVSGLDTRADLCLRTDQDVEVEITASFGQSPFGCGYTAIGEEGALSARFQPEPQSLILARAGREPQPIAVPQADDTSVAGVFTRAGYGLQLAHFASAALGEIAPRLDAAAGERTLRSLALGYRSFRTGRSARHDEALMDDAPPCAHLLA